jgi:hypothetical protein
MLYNSAGNSYYEKGVAKLLKKAFLFLNDLRGAPRIASVHTGLSANLIIEKFDTV